MMRIPKLPRPQRWCAPGFVVRHYRTSAGKLAAFVDSPTNPWLDDRVHELSDTKGNDNDKLVKVQQIVDGLQRGDTLSEYSLNILHDKWLQYSRRIDLSRYSRTVSGQLASLLVHDYTVSQRYKEALALIDSTPKHVDKFCVDLLAIHLLIRGNLQDLLDLMTILEKHEYAFGLQPQVIAEWADKVIRDEKNRLALITRFSRLLGPVTTTYGLLERMAELLAKSMLFTPLAAVIRHSVDRMHKERLRPQRVEQFKDKMTLYRFNGYIGKLGGPAVVSCGYFDNLGFNRTQRWRVADFTSLTTSLAAKNPQMSYDDAILLIQQLNGFHVKEFKNRYSPLLTPNVQLGRLTDTQVAESSLGKPEKMSEKYRNRSQATQNKTFNVLPLNIVLKVIGDTTNDHELALLLMRSMMKKQNCPPNSETFLYLFRILCAKEESAESVMPLYNAFRDRIQLNRQMHRLIIDVLVKANDPDALYRLLQSYSAKYPISGDLLEQVQPVLGDKTADFSITLQ